MILKHNYFIYTIFILAIFGIILFSGCTQQTSTVPAPQPEAAPVVTPTLSPEPAPSPDLTKDFLTFNDPTYGMSIKYPSDWTKIDIQLGDDTGPMLAWFMAPIKSDIGGSSFIVGVEDTSNKPMTLEEYNDYSTNQIKKKFDGADFTLLESSPITIDGKPGHKLIFTGKHINGKTLKETAIWVMKNDKFYYNILYGGYVDPFPTLQVTAEAMVSSIKFSEPTAPAKPTEEFLTYENPAEGIKIQYPSSWTKDESGLNVVVFISPQESVSDMFQENTGIGIEDLSAQPMTLDQFTKLTVADITEMVSSENILESTATTLDGNPAHKLVYNRKSGADTYKFMQIWTIKNNRVYIISYVAETDNTYSNFLVTLTKMIDSFEITPISAPTTTNKFLEYTNSEENIKMKYPSVWSKKEKYAGTTVSFISLKGNVNVAIDDLSAEPMTLSEYTEYSLAQLEYFIPDMKVIESSETATLGGNRAYKLVYVGTIEESVFKWMQIWTIKDDKAYVLSYTASLQDYPSSLDKVNEMVNSFKFT